MAAFPLFRDTNMAAVTSRENTLYKKNSCINITDQILLAINWRDLYSQFRWYRSMQRMGQDQVRDIETSRLWTSADRSFKLQRGKIVPLSFGRK